MLGSREFWLSVWDNLRRQDPTTFGSGNYCLLGFFFAGRFVIVDTERILIFQFFYRRLWFEILRFSSVAEINFVFQAPSKKAGKKVANNAKKGSSDIRKIAKVYEII